MSRAITPWATLVTSDQESFVIEMHRNRVTARVTGLRRSQSVLNMSTKTITQGDSVVTPFRIKLDPWTSSEPPVVRAHPFLVLHLLATAQVDPDELASRLSKGSSVLYGNYAITRPCHLLRMLGCNRAALTLATNLNFTTAQG